MPGRQGNSFKLWQQLLSLPLLGNLEEVEKRVLREDDEQDAVPVPNIVRQNSQKRK